MVLFLFYICIHDFFCIPALKNSHPIEVEVGHPSEVDEIFDNISYNKGASVIRMLHDFIGRDAFKTGMQHYLTTYSYKNTSTEDLWASLETASGKPVGKVMTTWTSQMGFPIVHVDSMTDGDGKTVLTLNQEKLKIIAVDAVTLPEKFYFAVQIYSVLALFRFCLL